LSLSKCVRWMGESSEFRVQGSEFRVNCCWMLAAGFWFLLILPTAFWIIVPGFRVSGFPSFRLRLIGRACLSADRKSNLWFWGCLLLVPALWTDRPLESWFLVLGSFLLVNCLLPAATANYLITPRIMFYNILPIPALLILAFNSNPMRRIMELK